MYREVNACLPALFPVTIRTNLFNISLRIAGWKRYVILLFPIFVAKLQWVFGG
jgi:hypothetical protein